MFIKVVDLCGGKRFFWCVGMDNTIGWIRKTLAMQLSSNPLGSPGAVNFRLGFRNQSLSDHLSLGHYGIQEYDTLWLVPEVRSGN